MSQKRKKNGDIFEISLMPYFNLYAYAKYISVTKYFPNARRPDILRVFNLFSKESLPIENIDTRDLLFNPIYIAGGNGLIKLYKFIANEAISSEDKIFPPFRMLIDGDDLDYESYSHDAAWELVSPLDHKQNKITPLSYEDVKMFDPIWLGTNIDYLSFRISVEICKVTLNDMFNDFEFDWYQKGIYTVSLDMPTIVNEINYR